LCCIDLRKRKRQRKWQREKDLLLSLEKDGNETQLLEGLEFPSWNSSLSLRCEDHEGHNNGSDDAEDGVELHFC